MGLQTEIEKEIQQEIDEIVGDLGGRAEEGKILVEKIANYLTLQITNPQRAETHAQTIAHLKGSLQSLVASTQFDTEAAVRLALGKVFSKAIGIAIAAL